MNGSDNSWARSRMPGARVAHAVAGMLHPQHYPSGEGRIEISNEELGHLIGASRQRAVISRLMAEAAGLMVTDSFATILDQRF